MPERPADAQVLMEQATPGPAEKIAERGAGSHGHAASVHVAMWTW